MSKENDCINWKKTYICSVDEFPYCLGKKECITYSKKEVGNKEGCCLKEEGVCDNLTGRNYMSWAKGVNKKENASILYEVLKEKCNQLNPENKFDVDNMTEIVAVTISKDLWEFLKENPLKNKLDWVLASKYRISEMKSECPLCHFYTSCIDCCLKNNCLSGSEYYRLWVKANDWKEDQSAKFYATHIYNIINDKYNKLIQSPFIPKYKYSHKQIMTGWFRVPSRDNVSSWFRVWIFNPNEKKYGVTMDRTVRYTREEFNDWEYSELPPE